jgi:lactoylglutathione lyase
LSEGDRLFVTGGHCFARRCFLRIEHVALWTGRLERLRAFYETYLGATAGAKYTNPGRGFESYFLSFASGARLELMRQAGREAAPGHGHVAFALGAKQAVDKLTARLAADGYRVVDGPRWTGDGYYEAVALDPDGNRVELTV